jgi:hypothetical protein
MDVKYPKMKEASLVMSSDVLNKYMYSKKNILLVLPGIEPGGIIFPSQNNNIISYSLSVL